MYDVFVIKKENDKKNVFYRVVNKINVRDRRGNIKWTIHRNQQHRVHNPEKLATQGTQSRETSNIGYTIQRNQQHRVHKTEKLATYGPQDRETNQNHNTVYVDTTIRKQTHIT